VDTTKSEPVVLRDRRRKHTDEFKAAVVAECARPGISIARVALRHGLNANLLRKWVVNGERSVTSARTAESTTAVVKTTELATPQFVALPMESPAPSPRSEIEVEIRRGATVVKVNWPMSASAECGAWLRELMR
jgi:transposase-like protein